MITVYEKAFFPKGEPAPSAGTILSKLTIDVKSLQSPKTPFVGQENHTIITNSTGIYVLAENLYGVSRALSTVAQIIVEKPGTEY